MFLNTSIYDNGAKAAMGGFAAFETIEGVTQASVFFDPINSLVEGALTIAEYKANVLAAYKKTAEKLPG